MSGKECLVIRRHPAIDRGYDRNPKPRTKETPTNKGRELDKSERDIANKVTPSFVQVSILTTLIGIIAVYPIFKYIIEEMKLKD